MATLIQSKQIQGVVTASVIEGEFVVSGSLVTTGSLFVDGDITASGVIRGVFLEGDGSRLTGIVAEGTGINLLSGSIDIVASQFEFSGSGVKINTINTNTASINIPSGYEESGLFRTYSTLNLLLSSSITNFSDGQLVYVIDTNSVYQADIIYADMVTTFTDIISWNLYTFSIGDSSVNAGEGLSKSVSSGITTLTLNTSSLHFQQGVEYVISSGSYIIDSGLI
jgi:hypothetical protein